MKSLLRSTVLLAAVATGIAATPVQAGAHTHQPTHEGGRFTRIDQPQPVRATARTEALEFFWYDCGHSQQLEQPLQSWAARHGEDVELRRVPAIWPGSPEESVQRGHARLYYALEHLGLVDRLQVAAFRAVHTEDRDVATESGATAWAVQQGVDGQEFRNAFRSAEVEQAVEEAARMFVEHRIDELPTVIVQGGDRTTPSRAGGVAAMPEVMDRLVREDQERRP
ncbi:thiol:disulfide interchange protein DsbA/DsbL [Kitasatospora sp. NPDC004240]